MWIHLNDSFLSIVDHDKKLLKVRARCKGDIERVFPHAKVYKTLKRDYLFRAFIPREEVAKKIAKRITRINYRNFKNSVKEQDRHGAYFGCWDEMLSLQQDRVFAETKKCLLGKRPRLAESLGDELCKD